MQSNDLFNFLSNDGKIEPTFSAFREAVLALFDTISKDPEKTMKPSAISSNISKRKNSESNNFVEKTKTEVINIFNTALENSQSGEKVAIQKDLLIQKLEAISENFKGMNEKQYVNESEIVILKKELEDLHKNEQKLVDESVNLKIELDELRIEKASLQKAINEYEEKAQALTKKLTNTEHALSEAERRAYSSAEQLNLLTRDKDRLTRLVEAERQTSINLTEKAQNNESKQQDELNMKLRASIKENEAKFSTLQIENAKLKFEMDIQAQQNEALKKKIVGLETQIDSQKAKLKMVSKATIDKPLEKKYLTEHESFAMMDEEKPPMVSSPKHSMIAPSEADNRSVFHFHRLNINRMRDNEDYTKASLKIEFAPEQNTPMDFFVESVFICDMKAKKFAILALKMRKLYILDPVVNTKIMIQINMDKIVRISNSLKQKNFFSIHHLTDSGNVEVIYLEVFSVDRFILEMGNNGLSSKIENEPVELEKVANFLNAAMPIFQSTIKSGVVEMWVNTIMTDWALVFISLIDEFLLVIPISKVISYSDYKAVFSRISSHRLDSWNLFTEPEKIGLRKSNMFALKVNNENLDLIFSCSSAEDKQSWVEKFTSN